MAKYIAMDEGHKVRCRQELLELEGRQESLLIFLSSEAVEKIDPEDKSLLLQQSFAMGQYAKLLRTRLHRHGVTDV